MGPILDVLDQPATGKRYGEIFAFVHFAVTEMRPLWLVWYTVFNTFKNIVTSAAISEAYQVEAVTFCLFEKKITTKDIKDCAKTAYEKYLASGPPTRFECSKVCPGSEVGIFAPEPRIMFFFMTAWLFGFLLLFLVYCIYRRPNYHTGSYIKFTQTLYASKPYKLVAFSTFGVSVVIILLGIYFLMKYGEGWTQYIVSLLLMVMASRSLLHKKSNGVNINSESFCKVEICHGNLLMRVLNFILLTNTALLDELEVQLMKKSLPEGIAAPEKRTNRWAAIFTWYPLTDASVNELLGRDIRKEGYTNEMIENV